MLDTKLNPWPDYTEEEITAVAEVLRSNKVNYWTGEESRAFEREFAQYLGCQHAIALANGTLAMDLALRTLGIGAGDEVIVTPRSFIASASCIVNAGAIPVFADIDRDSQNITAETIEQVLTPRTRAIICVHLAGWPCEMQPIMELAKKQSLYVIEDCAQAHGARYRGKAVGTIGDMGAWSFCQDKIITTGGEGGMLTLNNEDWWRSAWAYKDHGKSWQAVYEKQHPRGFRWLHESFGTNWRITEIQSVLGRIQLRRLDDWKKRRQWLAAQIDQVAQQYRCIRVPTIPEHIDHARYKHYLFIEPQYLHSGITRDTIIEQLTQRGVPCYQGSCSEMYLEKAFDNTAYRPQKNLRVAQDLGQTSLMFLVHPTITDKQMGWMCGELDKLFQKICRQDKT